MYITNNDFFSCEQTLSLYCFIILVLCFPFLLEGFCIFLATLKYPWIFQSILCQMDKLNLFLSTNVLSFDVLTILIHRFLLLFSILSEKEKFYVKRKNNTQSSCIIFLSFFFFRILCRMNISFKKFVIYQSSITININNM